MFSNFCSYTDEKKEKDLDKRKIPRLLPKRKCIQTPTENYLITLTVKSKNITNRFSNHRRIETAMIYTIETSIITHI